jgi:hypothetical protein
MDLNAAATQIRQYRERHRAMDVLADALDQIGNIESAITESQARLEQAKAAESEVTGRLESLRLTLIDEERANAARVSDAEKHADDIIAGAEALGKAKAEGAEAMAAAVVDKARDEARAIIDKASRDAADAQTAANLARDSMQKSELRLADLDALTAEAQGRLNALNAAIDSIVNRR